MYNTRADQIDIILGNERTPQDACGVSLMCNGPKSFGKVFESRKNSSMKLSLSAIPKRILYWPRNICSDRFHERRLIGQEERLVVKLKKSWCCAKSSTDLLSCAFRLLWWLKVVFIGSRCLLTEFSLGLIHTKIIERGSILVFKNKFNSSSNVNHYLLPFPTSYRVKFYFNIMYLWNLN